MKSAEKGDFPHPPPPDEIFLCHLTESKPSPSFLPSFLPGNALFANLTSGANAIPRSLAGNRRIRRNSTVR